MARVGTRRTIGSGALSAAVVLLLTACLPFPPLGESSNGMKNSIDTTAVAEAVTATSDAIETTIVETTIDGLTTALYVRPQISTESLTPAELEGVLRVAYELTRGEVATIQVRTVDSADEPLDLSVAAGELGIRHLTHINSVSYSTTNLETAFSE